MSTNKTPPQKKNFHTPVEKKFWPPKAAAKFFVDTPPVYTPPLSQNPCPPMIESKEIDFTKKFDDSKIIFFQINDMYICIPKYI